MDNCNKFYRVFLCRSFFNYRRDSHSTRNIFIIIADRFHIMDLWPIAVLYEAGWNICGYWNYMVVTWLADWLRLTCRRFFLLHIMLLAMYRNYSGFASAFILMMEGVVVLKKPHRKKVRYVVKTCYKLPYSVDPNYICVL